MSCQNYEELIIRYSEDDVSAQERAAVDSHVAECSACADALAEYQALETSLLSRREMLPHPARTINAVVARVGLVEKPPWWSFIVRPISVPAALSTALIALGVVLFLARDSAAQWLSGVLPTEGSADGLARFIESLGDSVVSFAGANQIVVMTLYFGVFGLIFFTGSVMVLRFVRE